MVKMGMVVGNLARNRNTSVHGTGKFLRGHVLKHSHRIRELATRDLLDKSIVAQTMGVSLIETQ